ncbi:hypothetical protein AAG570_005229 [Ranatra chinensis]|uniref:Uncharacterized protein n=1 Tax=Ranatra chinensis TaxID=642074 RepID=A0ABD0Y0R2_9HEMI
MFTEDSLVTEGVEIRFGPTNSTTRERDDRSGPGNASILTVRIHQLKCYPQAGMSTSSRDRKWWDLQRVFPFAFWKSNEEVDNCPEEEDAVAEECRERELTPTKYRKPPVPDIRFSFLEGEEPKRQEDEDEESESYASTLDTAGVPHEESEEEQGATNAALMSTLTLTFSVKEENLYEIVAERPQLGEATATYSSPREAAVASLAPVYSSVDKQKRSPLPPPLPSPDWDPEPVDVPGQGALTPAVWKKRTRLDKAWTTVKKWWNNGAVLQPPQSTPTSPVASTLALWPLHQVGSTRLS